MRITFHHQIVGAKADAGKVRRLLQKASRELKCRKDAAVSIILIGDAKMRALNKTYRKKNKTTNVLAFPTGDNIDLGDVFISVPEARREAKRYGHKFDYELQRLALHGLLHLLGYDHKKDKDAKKMEKLETKLLC